MSPADAPTDRSRRVALVDDDPQIRKLVERYLGANGLQVVAFESAESFWPAFQDLPVAMVILDVMLPGEDGFSLATRLRRTSQVGIIMLTDKGETVDRVVGLEVGADDYVAKPFELRELLARVRSLMRRLPQAGSHAATSVDEPGRGEPDTMRFEGWQLNAKTRTLLSPAGEEVSLTSKEFDLLALLARHPNQPLSRDRILDQLDGRERHPYDRSIDVLIFQLRSKLEAGDGPPRLLKTVRGVGYMLACAEES